MAKIYLIGGEDQRLRTLGVADGFLPRTFDHDLLEGVFGQYLDKRVMVLFHIYETGSLLTSYFDAHNDGKTSYHRDADDAHEISLINPDVVIAELDPAGNHERLVRELKSLKPKVVPIR